MRRAVKFPDSKIVSDNLKYSLRSSSKNKRIAEILLREQRNICAYTDESLNVTNPGEVEHFNPALKGTPDDNYTNWFLVNHQWNKKKAYKWNNFQPILHPTAPDFEERIIYKSGHYFSKSDSNVEAKNLINLLRLDDPALADKRKRYIKRKRSDMEAYGQTPTAYFSVLLETEPCGISYPRALKEEFGVDLWQTLPQQT